MLILVVTAITVGITIFVYQYCEQNTYNSWM